MKIDRGNFTANAQFIHSSGLLSSGKKVLEIGSGNGSMVKYLKDRGVDIIGTELNEKYIENARKLFKVQLHKMDGEHLAFGDGSFDVVLSFDVFEHIPNSRQHLREVHRVLRNGGHYLFQTPNKWTSTLASVVNNRSLTKHKKSHCSLQTKSSLKRLLRVQHFSYEFIKVDVMTSFLESKIRRVFGRILGGIIIRARLPVLLESNLYVIARKVGEK